MEEEYFELEFENAHPKALEILTEEFYFDPTEEAAPFGNDDGNDAFYDFLTWRKRNPDQKPFQFVRELIDRWRYTNDYYRETDPERIKSLIEEEGYGFFPRDNALVAVCFGQLVLEGEIDPEMKELTLIALERQKQPVFMQEFRQEYHQQRLAIIDKMIADLKRME